MKGTQEIFNDVDSLGFMVLLNEYCPDLPDM